MEIRRGHRYLYHKVVLAAFFFSSSKQVEGTVKHHLGRLQTKGKIFCFYTPTEFFFNIKKNAASLECRMKNKDLKECGTSTV